MSSLIKQGRIEPILKPGSKLMIVGEAPGEKEVEKNRPFIGASGNLQKKFMAGVGLNMEDCSLTNVFLDRPYGNKIDEFTTDKADLPAGYAYAPLMQGKYVKPEYLSELARLREEILTVKPNLVLGVGAVALWGLTGLNKIGRYRGSIMESKLVPGQKCLFTYHPAGLFRNWANSSIYQVDLLKAAGECQFPDIRRKPRRILINPTEEEIYRFFSIYPHRGRMSFDLETVGGNFISCISFAPSDEVGICIPFVLFDQKGLPESPYWDSLETELRVWNFVRNILKNAAIPKLAQNGLFDIQMLGLINIPIRNYKYDTMIAQASLMPELPKSLEFLGSVYTNEVAWKTLKPKRVKARTNRKAND